jgi:hypothetical protein
MADRFLDITPKLGKVRNRVYRVGVELEGAWKKAPEGHIIIRDGSVSFNPRENPIDAAWGKVKYPHIGEIPSPVLLPEGKVNDLTLEKWMRKCYPDLVNHTCGLHVHMSFRNAFQYAYLMDERLQWTVLEFVTRWAKEKGKLTFDRDHHIWSRIRGESEFCQHKFDADEQCQKTRKEFDHHGVGHRYTVMNYALMKTGTIECRLLPMMVGVELALEAVRLVMNITSAFLVSVAEEKGVMLDGKVAGKGEKPVVSEWAPGVDPMHRETLVMEV